MQEIQETQEKVTQDVDLNDIKWKTIKDLVVDYLEETKQTVNMQKFVQKLLSWEINTIEDLETAEVSKYDLLKERELGPSKVEFFWKALVHNKLDNPIILGTKYTAPDETTSFKAIRIPFIEKRKMNKPEQAALTALINSLSLSNVKNFKTFKKNPKILKRYRAYSNIGDAGIGLFKEMIKNFGFKLNAKATN